MVNKGKTVVKSGGSTTENKPAVAYITVAGAEAPLRVEAEHTIVNEAKTILFLGPRSDGIDFVIGTSDVLLARSERAEDLIDAHISDDAGSDEESSTDTHGDETELIADGGQTPAELLFGSRIHELPFLFACTDDGDTFIDDRHYSESDRATLCEFDAPRGSGYDLIVGETGEVLRSGGELTANMNWEALACEACSEAFLFISVDEAPESCPECGATADCGEENGGDE